MCARVDTGKENQGKGKVKRNMSIYNILIYSYDYGPFVIFIIRNIPEQKYFADIKPVTVIADSPDLGDSVTELAYSMLKSVTPHMGITIEEGNILVYISGYICYKVSRSACDQCTVILMPIIKCIHVWGFCSTSINWFKWTNFRNIPEHILHRSHKKRLLRSSKTVNHMQIVNVSC